MDNFVEVIAEYDKAQGRRWRFIAFTIVVFSVAGIYLLSVIVERYNTPRFLTIQQQIDVTIESTEGEAQMLSSPSEESPSEASAEETSNPTEQSVLATPSLHPILAQATERAWSAQQSSRGR